MKFQADRPPRRCLCAIALAAACTGCTTLDETASNLFSSKTEVAAVFAGRVLQGQANFTSAREATVRLQSKDLPSLACFGALRFTATHSGVAGFSCSDGQMVSIPFQSLSPMRGSGRSQTGNSQFTLTYGLPPEMAAPYLGLPVEQLMRPASAIDSRPAPE